MAALARRMPPRAGALLAVAAVLIAAAVLATGTLALSLLRGGASTTPVPSIGVAEAVQPPALATPIDVAQFHATAEAGLNRPPEQRQAAPTPTPPPAPTKPSALGQPAPAKPGAPAPAPAVPLGTVAPVRTPLP